jgi:hypothetical protein
MTRRMRLAMEEKICNKISPKTCQPGILAQSARDCPLRLFYSHCFPSTFRGDGCGTGPATNGRLWRQGVFSRWNVDGAKRRESGNGGRRKPARAGFRRTVLASTVRARRKTMNGTGTRGIFNCTPDDAVGCGGVPAAPRRAPAPLHRCNRVGLKPAVLGRRPPENRRSESKSRQSDSRKGRSGGRVAHLKCQDTYSSPCCLAEFSFEPCLPRDAPRSLVWRWCNVGF